MYKYIYMSDENLIMIKCPLCNKEFGISPNAFDQVDTIEIECNNGGMLLISMDKETKTLTIKQNV